MIISLEIAAILPIGRGFYASRLGAMIPGNPWSFGSQLGEQPTRSPAMDEAKLAFGVLPHPEQLGPWGMAGERRTNPAGRANQDVP